MRITLLLTLSLALTIGINAEDLPGLQHGFAVDKTFHMPNDGIDNVNLFSGNLTLQIPIGRAYPIGDGSAYQLNLFSASKVWDFDQHIGTSPTPPYESYYSFEAVPGRTFNAGLGWTLSLGRLVPAPANTVRFVPYDYESADGSRHVFFESRKDVVDGTRWHSLFLGAIGDSLRCGVVLPLPIRKRNRSVDG